MDCFLTMLAFSLGGYWHFQEANLLLIFPQLILIVGRLPSYIPTYWLTPPSPPPFHWEVTLFPNWVSIWKQPQNIKEPT